MARFAQADPTAQKETRGTMPETKRRTLAATAVMAALGVLAAGCVTSSEPSELPAPTTLAVPEDAPETEEEVGLGGDAEAQSGEVASCEDLTNFIFTMANKLEQAFKLHFGDEALWSAVQSPTDPMDPPAEPPVAENAPSAADYAGAVDAMRAWISGPTPEDRHAMREACYLAGVHQGARLQWTEGQQETACLAWKTAGTRSNSNASTMHPTYPVAQRLLGSAQASIWEGNGLCNTWKPGAGATPEPLTRPSAEDGAEDGDGAEADDEGAAGEDG